MTEPTVTFKGVVTLSEAKRLVAEAEAKAQTVYVTLKSRYVDADPTIYRVQPHGTTHYVGPDGEWAPLGYPWPLGRTTGDDVYVVTEADTVRQQEARRSKPQPVVGQMYRHSGATDGEPHKTGRALLRYDGDAQWSVRYSDNPKWITLGVSIHESWSQWLAEGTFVPYTPPIWTPQVGAWVVVDGVNTTARKVSRIEGTRHYLDYNGREGVCGFEASDLRPATPEEITAAKRIVVKDGLIVRAKDSDQVWRWHSACSQWVCLSRTYKPAYQLFHLDTDHYTVLDEYVVKGVR